MSKPARGSLASLAVPKVVAAPTPAQPPDAEAPAASPRPANVPTPRQAQEDVKVISARVNKEGWRVLRDLALDLDTNLEALVVDALNDLLLKHAQPPVVQRRIGVRGKERQE